MTQEAFKAWWYNEGSQAPYTHHDCEEHTMRMCEIAWNKAQALAQPEQKMVMWPCLIDTADFSKGTVTIVMQCEDYKVSAGTHWLSTTPPKGTT